MAPMLRIARVDLAGQRLLLGELAALPRLAAALQAVIRRHLPGRSATVLATPVLVADGQQLDWFSELAGQPVPLGALPPARQVLARARLADRLTALRRLAAALPAAGGALGSGDEGRRNHAALAAALRVAALAPADQQVYLVGSEPVVIGWGFAKGGVGIGTGIGTGIRTGTAAADRRRTARWVAFWSGLPMLLLLAALATWYGLQQWQAKALETELARAAAADCARPAQLAALAAQLDRRAPGAVGQAGLRARLTAEQAHCEQAQTLAAELAAAAGDCARLAAVRVGLPATAAVERPPLTALVERLAAEVGRCAHAAGWQRRLFAARGDCTALAGLARELDAQPVSAFEPASAPLRQVQQDVAREGARCALAARLAEALGPVETGTQAGVAAPAVPRQDCAALRGLAQELSAADPRRPPLDALRVRLDHALQRCSAAADYQQALVAAQLDCTRLRALDARMDAEAGADDGPLQAVRAQLEAALARCADLDAAAKD